MPNVGAIQTIIVTGAAGFIGSQVARLLLQSGHRVVVYDALTYSGRRENLTDLEEQGDYEFIEGSINDPSLLAPLLKTESPAAIINLAAETHVDRSIEGPARFLETNVSGSQTLLNECLNYWRDLPEKARDQFRFVQVSTDEVYGSLETGAATEESRFAPNSPYAASNAAADHFIRAYTETYGLPTITTLGGNTYGPRQFPEKFIPRLLLRGLSGNSLPVYGSGTNVREWISVEDHATGILTALEKGTPGQSYNIGCESGISNLAVADMICEILEIDPDVSIEFVEDRPGHDQRYAMDCSKARTELGWEASSDLALALPSVINWYQENPDWWRPILTEEYDLSRLGLIGQSET